MSENYIFKTSANQKIRISTFGNSNLENGSCIIFVHGFKGFKDWGFGPYLANYFAEKGFFVITFNFSHNGVGKSLTEFDELEKFANNTFSREVDELSEIISAYQNGFFGKTSGKNKIGLIGHSRGGAIAILAASKMQNVNALVTWAAISKFDRYTKRQKEEWNKKGFIEMLNTRTKQLMRLNKTLLEDINANSKTKLNIEKALENLRKPYLIIHGEQDLAVPVKEAEKLFGWSIEQSAKLEIIKGTGHTFDIKHPFDGSTKAFDIVLSKTLDFFNSSFNKN